MVGGGLAGLATALDLKARGFDVVVLEAQDRVGGRIATIRVPFHEGLYAEAGALHVVGDPDLVALCERVGVTIASGPRPPQRGAQVRFVGGGREVTSGDAPDPPLPGLSAEEITLGSAGRRARYFTAAATLDPLLLAPTSEDLVALDRLSLGQHLRALGASTAYIDDFGDGFSMGEGADAPSALGVVRELANIQRERGLKGGGRIPGGTDRLPSALADRLGDRVIRGAQVRRITTRSDRVEVGFVRGGVETRIDAARVVLAIPFSVLRHVEVAPGLSPMKRRAVEEIPSASVVRMFAEARTRFWDARGESGTADTDLSVGRVRDETVFLPGTPGVLGAYLSGQAARAFCKRAPEDRARTLITDLERVHPGIRDACTATFVKAWDEDPFARGAYAWFRPGQLAELGPHVATPEGRLHFAGDHTSHRPGFMHGAVASAKRVVGEVVATVDRT